MIKFIKAIWCAYKFFKNCKHEKDEQGNSHFKFYDGNGVSMTLKELIVPKPKDK